MADETLYGLTAASTVAVTAVRSGYDGTTARYDRNATNTECRAVRSEGVSMKTGVSLVNENYL